MVKKEDVKVVKRSKIPERVIGSYTFLKELAEKLDSDETLELIAVNLIEARKVQSRWRSYFKMKAHSRKMAQPKGTYLVYLWRDK